MDSKYTLSITEARKRIFDIANDVQKPGSYYILTDKGRPKAIVMSAAEYDSLMETVEVYQQFPDLDKDIKKAEKEVAEGKSLSLDEVLAEYGLMVNDKGKQAYVARPNRKKRKKRS